MSWLVCWENKHENNDINDISLFLIRNLTEEYDWIGSKPTGRQGQFLGHSWITGYLSSCTFLNLNPLLLVHWGRGDLHEGWGVCWGKNQELWWGKNNFCLKIMTIWSVNIRNQDYTDIRFWSGRLIPPLVPSDSPEVQIHGEQSRLPKKEAEDTG